MSKYHYRTTPTNLKTKIPSRCIPVSVALITRDTSSVQYVAQLLNNGASYQVIPGPIYPYIHNVSQILAYVIPRTRNILLDICLPFNKGANQGKQEYYLGRYLIFDCKVVGIRLNTSEYVSAVLEDGSTISRYKTWPRYTKNQIGLPYFIEEIYKQSGVKTYKKKIVIGDFILSFKNARIYFLFQTEVTSIFKITRQFQYLNADILSVVADKAINSQTISKLDYERYSQSTNNHLGLQNYVQNEKKVAIYAGCKMKTANELHLSNSAILHHPNNLHCTDHHFMSEGEVLTNVIKIRQNRKFNFTDFQPKKGTAQIPIEAIHNLEINAMLHEVSKEHYNKIKRYYPLKTQFYGPIPRQITNIEEKMRLWFVFKHRNNSLPFLLALPLSGYAVELDYHWRQISSYNGQNLDNYVRYYRLPGDTTFMEDGKVYESLDELFELYKANKYMFFTQKPSERLKQIKYINPKIYIYSNPFTTENYSNKSYEQVNIERRLQDFATQVYQRKAFTINDIVRLNMKRGKDALTNDQLISVIEDQLGSKIRTNYAFNGDKYQFQCISREQIVQAIKMSQICHKKQLENLQKTDQRNGQISVSKQQTYGEIPEELTQHDRLNLSREQYAKRFFKRLSLARQRRKILSKRLRSDCHKCHEFEERQFVHTCDKCKNRTCYLCIDEITRGTLKTPEAFRHCVVCRKTCYCEKCIEMRKKRGVQLSQIEQSSLSIQALAKRFPNLSLNQLKQKSVEQQWQKDDCQICALKGLKPINIKVLCAKCQIEKGCFECIKRSEQNTSIRNKNWLCEKCNPAPIRSEIQRELELIRERSAEEEGRESPVIQPSRSFEDNTAKFGGNIGDRNKSPSHSPSPQVPRRGGGQVTQEREKNRSPSHSPSPQVPRRGNQRVQQRKNRSPSHSLSPQLPRRGIQRAQQKQNKEKEKSQAKSIQKSHEKSGAVSPAKNRDNKPDSRSRSREKEWKKKRSENEQKSQRGDQRERSVDPRLSDKKRGKQDPKKVVLWGPQVSGKKGSDKADIKQAGQAGKSQTGRIQRDRSESPISERERERLIATQQSQQIEDLDPIDDY